MNEFIIFAFFIRTYQTSLTFFLEVLQNLLNATNNTINKMRCLPFLAFAGTLSNLDAFSTPNSIPKRSSLTAVKSEYEVAVGKPTGTSFLPDETLGRAKEGSPVEKIKLEKDGTSAFVDVYEYARKIRQGEMTWEEVEKADLDTVCERILFV
jgi:hypothetical protein